MGQLSGVALLVGGLLLLQGVPRPLARSSALARSPRVSVALWQAVLASGISCLLLGSLTVAVPNAWVSHRLGDLLTVCDRSLRAAYRTPGGTLGTTAGLLLSTLLLGALARGVAHALRASRAARNDVRELLALVAEPLPSVAPRALVVDHPGATAYCLPGRAPLLPGRAGGCIVLSRGALDHLDETQLRAVLAHEHAHLDQRHHLVLLMADAVVAALPFLHGPAVARREIAGLLEMAADDVAVGLCDRRAVASALVDLANRIPAAGVLAAGSTAAALRVRRLLAPQRPLAPAGRAGLAMGSASLLLLPVVVAAAPGLAVAVQRVCIT